MRYLIATQPSRRLFMLGAVAWIAGLVIILWQASGSSWTWLIVLAWICYGIVLLQSWYRSDSLMGEYDDEAYFYPEQIPAQIWQISAHSRVSDWGMVLVMTEIRPGNTQRRQYMIWRDSLPEADYRRLVRLCHQHR